MIKEVFMVPPTYTDVLYKINPWMGEKTDKTILEKQWNALFDVHIDLFGKNKVHRLEPKKDVPELCFCGDSVFLINGKAIFGNFLHTKRVKERDVMKDLLRPFEFEYYQIPQKLTYEGSGETLVLGDKLVLGHGIRTSVDVIPHLKEWSKKDAIGMRMINEKFFHLDMALLPLRDNQVMFYAPAFDEKSLEQFNTICAESGIEKIFIDEPFAMEFALNSVVHGDKIVVHSGAKQTIPHFKTLGFDVIEVDVSEFLKLGGGVKCLTLMHHEV